MTTPVGVTGSTGVVGGLVAERLAAAGVPMRLIVRDASRAPVLPDADVRVAAYADPVASVAALEGVELLFMVSAAENEHRLDEHRTFVAAARRAGVRHVVYTSFYGAAADAVFTLGRDHYATEELLKASGMAYTFLRDNVYLEYLPLFAGEEGVIRGPAGDGRLSAVSQRDVAAVASTVLLSPSRHVDATYLLTGPESLSLEQAAEIITRVTGHSVRYDEESLEEAYASRARYGAPKWQLDAWVSTYVAIARGEMDGVTDDVERVTGQAPLSLEQALDGF
jgi:NAD(P)H dehydrogenase (quinone)